MGTLLWQLNDCWPVASWSITDYDKRLPKAGWYAVREAYRDDVTPSRDLIRPKDLSLKNPEIHYTIKVNQLILQSENFAKYVFVELAGHPGKWSDNYFDLEPGKQKTITFEQNIEKEAVKITSLWEVLNHYQ